MARDPGARKGKPAQISARVKPESYHLLTAICAVTSDHQGRVLEQALTAYEKTLSHADRLLVAQLVKRQAKP